MQLYYSDPTCKKSRKGTALGGMTPAAAALICDDSDKKRTSDYWIEKYAPYAESASIRRQTNGHIGAEMNISARGTVCASMTGDKRQDFARLEYLRDGCPRRAKQNGMHQSAVIISAVYR